MPGNNLDGRADPGVERTADESSPKTRKDVTEASIESFKLQKRRTITTGWN